MSNSTALIDRLRNVELGAVTDAMRQMSIDGWMMNLYPINDDSRITGRAFTMTYALEPDNSAPGFKYYELLGETQEGDVIILAAGSTPLAIMGENMQHAAKMCGIEAIICDGSNRDTPVIKTCTPPVFSTGRAVKFAPANFKIIERQTPAMCGGVCVHPGDYIIGDSDGVIVLPQEAAAEIVDIAEKIMQVESEMEQALDSGKSMAECLQIISKKKGLYKKA